jgi:hypothetical protein
MDLTWWKLSEDEQQRARGLSADLYMLQDDEVYEAVTDAGRLEELQSALAQAVDKQDWPQVLQLLRCRPADAPVSAVAGLRGRAYVRLAHPAPAVQFLKYALERDPTNIRYRYELADALERLHRAAEGGEAGVEPSTDGMVAFDTPFPLEAGLGKRWTEDMSADFSAIYGSKVAA